MDSDSEFQPFAEQLERVFSFIFLSYWLALYERRLKRKAEQIAGDQSHVLAKFFELLPSGRRYRTVKGKARLLKTFIPRSLHLLNS